jgi:hypothetical protein
MRTGVFVIVAGCADERDAGSERAANRVMTVSPSQRPMLVAKWDVQ